MYRGVNKYIKMKKLINDPSEVVTDQLKGMALAHPSLRVNLDPKYVVRADAPALSKVALISGGGSGHEPMHCGFVGPGMLDGACPGEVFTSPTPDQMYACAKAVNNGNGVLFLVKNYTGDILNFETAIEMAHADGMAVQSVLIDDDVAVKDSLYTAGRRGVGTTVIMEKIVGAAAESGDTLDQCAKLARRVNRFGRSLGMALTSCTVPGTGKQTFELGDQEIEIGIGIHGEPGRRRVPHTTAREIAGILTREILDDAAYTRTIRSWDRKKGTWVEAEVTDKPFEPGDEVIAMINGMGGTPVAELYAVYAHVAEECGLRGITIVRNLIGSYITSLDMRGCSVTLVKADAEILEYWDAPVTTPGLSRGKGNSENLSS